MKNKIPLTIKHTKEHLKFFKMPKVRLLALLNLEFEKMAKEGINPDSEKKTDVMTSVLIYRNLDDTFTRQNLNDKEEVKDEK